MDKYYIYNKTETSMFFVFSDSMEDAIIQGEHIFDCHRSEFTVIHHNDINRLAKSLADRTLGMISELEYISKDEEKKLYFY